MPWEGERGQHRAMPAAAHSQTYARQSSKGSSDCEDEPSSPHAMRRIKDGAVSERVRLACLERLERCRAEQAIQAGDKRHSLVEDRPGDQQRVCCRSLAVA